MILPKRRKPEKMGLREETVVRCPSHLKWIRGHDCAVPGCVRPRVEAAHVRTGTDGSTGKKPGDNWAIPLCQKHHRRQHAIGELRFEDLLRIDMKKIAEALWQKSPHRVKYEKRTEAQNYSEQGE